MSSAKFSNDESDVDPLSTSEKRVYDLCEIDRAVPDLEPEEHTSGAKLKMPIFSIEQSENHKAAGNEHFKNRNFLDAYDSYTNAIEACPGMTGKDLLNVMNEFAETEREERKKECKNEVVHKRNVGDHEEKMISRNIYKKLPAPSHEYGDNLAIYHNNRAACLLHLERFDNGPTPILIQIYRYLKNFLNLFYESIACL